MNVKGFRKYKLTICHPFIANKRVDLKSFRLLIGLVVIDVNP
jgi:hypothetical protein